MKKSISPFAKPYPATHKGGINAVAIATPGTAFDLSFLVIEITPAKPPNIATNPSSKVGSVRPKISSSMEKLTWHQ